MKILHLGKFYFPVRGGIETVTQILAEGMVSLGDQVTVLSLSTSNQRSEEMLNGVLIKRMPSLTHLFSQPLSPKYFSAVKELAQSHDLVHLHGPHPLAEAAVLSLPPSVPVVLSYHAEVTRQKLLLPFYRPILKNILLRAQRILVSTPSMASVPRLSDFTDKVKIVPYGISEDRFIDTEVTHDEVRKLQKSYGRYILFIGRQVSYKGIEVLIQAAAKIDSHVVIVGDGPLRKELKGLAAQCGVTKRVHFLGAVNDPVQFSALLRASAALVLPSVTNAEAFGLVQIEAMACKKPCIVSHLSSGAADIIEDGVSGLLVPPGNPDALARAITQILSDEVKLSKMGNAAYRRFNENFRAERMIDRTREIYSELLKPVTASSPELQIAG